MRGSLAAIRPHGGERQGLATKGANMPQTKHLRIPAMSVILNVSELFAPVPDDFVVIW
jgi:hypothetical protein